MSKKAEEPAGIISLSSTNLDEWNISVKATLVPMGLAYASIVNQRKLPVSQLPVPTINDYHVDENEVEMLDFPKYKSVVKDDQGKPMKTPTGQLIYESTQHHYEALEKAKAARRTDTIRLDKMIATCAVLIMNSIPERSRNVLSTRSQARYEKAQSDPAELLNMIEETHQPTDDASLLNVMSEFLGCKQHDFNDDFLSFISEHSRLCRKFILKNNPKKVDDITTVLEGVAKSVLMCNCNHTQFHFILDGMNTGEMTLTYLKLVDKMTLYVQNTNVALTEKLLVASSRRHKGKSKPEQTNKTQEIAVVSIGAIDYTCEKCGGNMPSAIDGRTGLPFKNCRTCNKIANQVPARAVQDPTNPANKPNLSRAHLQNEYNKSLARIEKKEREKETAAAEMKRSGERPANSKVINPPMARATSQISKELERSAQKKALILSILDSDEEE